jgi:ribosomal protein L2
MSTSSAASSTCRHGRAAEYDPNRTAFIALLRYEDGELAYILARSACAPATR